MARMLAVAGMIVALLGAPRTEARGDDPLVIADLAPADTVALVGTDNWARMSEAWGRTSMSGLATDAAFAPLWKAMWESAEQGVDITSPVPETLGPLLPLLDNLGIAREDVPAPAGAAGLAVYVMSVDAAAAAREAKAEPAAEDPDDEHPEARMSAGQEPPGLLLSVDFGARGEEAEDVLVRAISALVRRGEARMTEEAYEGTTLRTFEFTTLDAWWAKVREARAKKADDEFRALAGEGEREAQWTPGAMMRTQPMPAMMRALRQVHVARRGAVLVIGNEAAVVREALDRLGGQKGEGISKQESYEAARRFVGEGAHVYGFMLMDTVDRLRDDEARAAGLGLLGGRQTLLGPILGLAGVRAVAAGVYLDGEKGPLELRVKAFQAAKRGFVALLDRAPDGFAPPAFAPSDAAAVATVYVRFDRAIAQLREEMSRMPEEGARLGEDQIAMIEAQAGPVLAVLGPRVDFVRTLERPLGRESSQGVVAIQVREAGPVTDLLRTWGAGLGGLKPRDFEGHQVWDMDARAPRISLGLGFGYVFLGQTRAVENAMRTAGNPGGALLAGGAFGKTVAGLRSGGAAYWYQDTRATIENILWSLRNPAPKVNFTMVDGRPQRAADAQPPEPPVWTRLLPDTEQWARFVGDIAAELMPTEDGIELVVYCARPR